MSVDEYIEIFWTSILGISLLVILITLGIAISADHGIKRYYMGHSMNTSLTQTCVKGKIDWETDDVVFCSLDSNASLEFMNKANASLIKK